MGEGERHICIPVGLQDDVLRLLSCREAEVRDDARIS
jgi:hypothetical protein